VINTNIQERLLRMLQFHHISALINTIIMFLQAFLPSTLDHKVPSSLPIVKILFKVTLFLASNMTLCRLKENCYSDKISCNTASRVVSQGWNVA
jgi:hypothetical protein